MMTTKIKAMTLQEITKLLYDVITGNTSFPADCIESAIEDTKTGFIMFSLKSSEEFQIKVEKIQ